MGAGNMIKHWYWSDLRLFGEGNTSSSAYKIYPEHKKALLAEFRVKISFALMINYEAHNPGSSIFCRKGDHSKASDHVTVNYIIASITIANDFS